jgi:hypothetical protein
VLRSKVAVFVDLWNMHRQVLDQAEECARLRAGVVEAAELLTAEPPAVQRARDRLIELRDR